MVTVNEKTFNTKKELAKYLNVDSGTLYSYLYNHKDMNIEDAVKAFKHNSHCFTFNGKKYKNQIDMCNDLGINLSTFKYYHNEKKLSLRMSVKICLEKNN